MSSNVVPPYLDCLYHFRGGVSGSKRFFTEVKPLHWDFPTYVRKLGLEGKTKHAINNSLDAYKDDLYWLLGQNLPVGLKFYINELGKKADASDLLRQVLARKTCRSFRNTQQTNYRYQTVLQIRQSSLTSRWRVDTALSWAISLGKHLLT